MAPYLVGLVGTGIGPSLTPALHMAEGRAQGVDYVYRTIDLNAVGVAAIRIREVLEWARALGFDALNITHPCKQAVIPHLHRLSDEARTIGAVNTVVLRGGERIGHNTDHYGFTQNIRDNLRDRAVGRVVQLGAGGAGSAVADAILRLGATSLTLFDQLGDRAEHLVQALRTRFPRAKVSVGRDLAGAMRQADGLINATPVGMRTLPGTPLPPALLESRHWFAEIIYFPLETELLRIARQKGCHTIDGIGMVVNQAARAFELYTNGIPADVARMKNHITDVLSTRAAAQSDGAR